MILYKSCTHMHPQRKFIFGKRKFRKVKKKLEMQSMKSCRNHQYFNYIFSRSTISNIAEIKLKKNKLHWFGFSEHMSTTFNIYCVECRRWQHFIKLIAFYLAHVPNTYLLAYSLSNNNKHSLSSVNLSLHYYKVIIYRRSAFYYSRKFLCQNLY